MTSTVSTTMCTGSQPIVVYLRPPLTQCVTQMRTTPGPIPIADTAEKGYNCAHHYSTKAVADDADVSTLQVRHCDGQASAYKARRGPPPGFL